jgi:cobalt-zinc-cadmium efflux system protein
VLAYRILHRGDPHDLNLRAASLHVLGDLLGSLGAIAAAVVIMTTGWTAIDPIVSLAVAAIILVGGSALVRQSAHVLLEGSPPEVDVPDLGRTLVAEVPEVVDVHHVHVWSIAPGRPIMTLHARVADDADPQGVLERVLERLRRRYGNAHVTVQLEHGPCLDDHPPDGAPAREPPQRGEES